MVELKAWEQLVGLKNLKASTFHVYSGPAVIGLLTSLSNKFNLNTV